MGNLLPFDLFCRPMEDSGKSGLKLISQNSFRRMLLNSAEMFRIAFATAFALAMLGTIARADPVISAHPRLRLTAAEKGRLPAKFSWQALKTRADTLATYSIHPYKLAASADTQAGTIYCTYQGEGCGVDQSASGNKTASPAGVLHFTLSSSSPPSRRHAVRH